MDDKKTFFDECHKYGWIINILVTFAMLAYFVGGQTQAIADLKETVSELKQDLTQTNKRIDNFITPRLK